MKRVDHPSVMVGHLRRFGGSETPCKWGTWDGICTIYVEAPDKSSGKRRQKIHIEYDGIGFIPLEELAKKETA